MYLRRLDVVKFLRSSQVQPFQLREKIGSALSSALATSCVARRDILGDKLRGVLDRVIFVHDNEAADHAADEALVRVDWVYFYCT